MSATIPVTKKYLKKHSAESFQWICHLTLLTDSACLDHFLKDSLLLVLTRNEGAEEQSIKLLRFDIFYLKRLSVNSSKSALSESGCIDMQGMSMQESACTNEVLPRFIISFCCNPLPSSLWMGIISQRADGHGSAPRSCGSQTPTQKPGSDGASGQGQHP